MEARGMAGIHLAAQGGDGGIVEELTQHPTATI